MNNSTFFVNTSQSPFAKLKPLPLTAIKLEGSFWGPRLRQNRQVSLPNQYRQLVETGRLWNFERAAGKVSGPYKGLFFNDSDVYKWVEAVAWSLAVVPDPSLQEMYESVASLIRAAQQPDGYLNTYFMFERAGERWTNLRVMHELYCAGHLIQAAIAARRGLGDEKLFDAACRLADHIVSVFRPGKRSGTPGHPEIEMALVELYRETGDHRYLDQAQSFIDNRGRGLIGSEVNLSDHQPFRQLELLAGHAVRALYLSAGAADLVAETGEHELRLALERLWERMAARQLYITGGAGSRYAGEAFGKDWELPNARAYAETCAGIASLMLNWRMLQLDGEARYADLLEWTLYNAVLPGISMDGTGYFYVNPLASDGSHQRQPWYECACCPPNVARTLAELPGYFYNLSEQGVWVHQYAQGSADLEAPAGGHLTLSQHTHYPWEGDVEIKIDSLEKGVEFSLFLRIPGWLPEDSGNGSQVNVRLNGDLLPAHIVPGRYLEIRRDWQPGDRLGLEFAMPMRFLESHPYALENRNRIALARGPILYCAEQADNPNTDLDELVISPSEPVHPDWLRDFPDQALALKTRALNYPLDPSWSGKLYRQYKGPSKTVQISSPYPLTFIPYFAWANRVPGQMRVWFNVAE